MIKFVIAFTRTSFKLFHLNTNRMSLYSLQFLDFGISVFLKYSPVVSSLILWAEVLTVPAMTAATPAAAACVCVCVAPSTFIYIGTGTKHGLLVADVILPLHIWSPTI